MKNENTSSPKPHILDVLRKAPSAEFFRHMSAPGAAGYAGKMMDALPDVVIDLMAEAAAIPPSQREVFRGLIRREDNAFTQRVAELDGRVHSGDVLLMTGTSLKSRTLVASQKAVYLKARSSHVALVHADYVCIDAVPKRGTANSVISETLSGIRPDWRVIRYKGLDAQALEAIQKQCIYYLYQSYRIAPGKTPAKTFSYCSELARKVYLEAGIEGTGIPAGALIKPCDFDRLADGHPDWTDVTEEVRPYVDFCREYEAIFKFMAVAFIDGLKLNRARFEQRARTMQAASTAAARGQLPAASAARIIEVLKRTERQLENTFWDTSER